MSDVTLILSQVEAGDSAATEQLLSLAYDELRRLAAAKLAHEKPGQTLQATALVHEAYLRLVGNGSSNPRGTLPAPSFRSRKHFFAAAAEAMRRILVDRARRKAAEKHGGHFARQPAFAADIAAAASNEEVVAVHNALDGLLAHDPLAGELVRLHYFGGFSLDEAGEMLGMSRATAYRMWTYARVWLRAELTSPDDSRRSAALLRR